MDIDSSSRKTDLCERLLQFAVDVIMYLRTVKNTIETVDMKRQLIKCSTSTGANYEESQGTYTKPDTKSKIAISLKEVREAHFFLKVFQKMKLGDMKACDYLVEESSELKKILGSIMRKL